MSSIPYAYRQAPAAGTTTSPVRATTPLGRRIQMRQSVASRQESIIVPIYKQLAGEYAQVPFPILRDYVTRDPDAWQASLYIPNKAFFNGYNITCDPKVPGSEDAADFLTDWLEYVRWGDARNERGFEALSWTIMHEMGWAGTSIVEQIGEEPPPEPVERITALAQLQISSIWRYQRDDFGQLRAIWQYPQINPRPLDPNRYIIYNFTTVDRNPFGFGLLHSMSQTKILQNGAVIPPMLDMKWQIEDDIRRRIHRYGNPRSIYVFPGMSEAQVKPMAEALSDPMADDSFASNSANANIVSDSPAGRMNFGPDLDFVHQRFMVGFANPLSKLMGETGFSYASSKAAEDLANIMVWSAQQAFKRTTENEILQPVLEQNGFDASLLKPRFNFSIPEKPEQFTLLDLINAAKPDPNTGVALITRDEFRKIVKDWANWDLDETPKLPGVNTNPRPEAPLSPPRTTLPPTAAYLIDHAMERRRRSG